MERRKMRVKEAIAENQATVEVSDKRETSNVESIDVGEHMQCGRVCL